MRRPSCFLRGRLSGRSLFRLGLCLRRAARLALGLRSCRARLLCYALELITKGARLNEHDIGPENVIRRDIGVRHHVSPLQVATAQKDILLEAVRKNQNFFIRHAERAEERNQLLGARHLVIEIVDHDHRILAGARIERALASERTNLARNGLVVLPSRRTENSSTAHPVRSAP